jgi:adenylate kinase
MSLNLIFLGPPGAGKGTVAQAVSDKYKLVQVSTGDLVRAEVASGSDFGKKLSEIINAGNLVNDEQISQMLETKLGAIFSEGKYKGIILDGYPRTIPQAGMLDSILSKFNQKLSAVIYLETNRQNVIDRISSRRTCSKCKKVYNVVTNPPKKVGVCDDDGSTLVQRDDEKAETIAYRYDVFIEKTMPLKEYYEKKGILKSYDTNVPVEESIKRAEKIIAGIAKQ